MKFWACAVFVGGLVIGCRGPAPRSVSPAPYEPAASASPAGLLPLEAAEVSARVRPSQTPFLLVNAWATWCAPCVAEFPDLVRIQQDFAGRVEVVFINFDGPTQRSAAEAFYRDSGAQGPGYLKVGPDEAFINAVTPEWSGSLPMTAVFDTEGRMVGFWEGPVHYTLISNDLLAWLEEIE